MLDTSLAYLERVVRIAVDIHIGTVYGDNSALLGEIKNAAFASIARVVGLASEETDSTLMKHQYEGIAWAVVKELAYTFFPFNIFLPRGGMCLDQMGMGKTIKFLTLAMSGHRMSPRQPDDETMQEKTLIIVPKPLLDTWRRDFIRFFGATLYAEHVEVVSEISTNALTKPSASIVLTSYSNFQFSHAKCPFFLSQKRYCPGISRFAHIPPWCIRAYVDPSGYRRYSFYKWKRIVVDEAHNLRNPKTRLHENIHALSSDSTWLLTGTPINNKLCDAVSLVQLACHSDKTLVPAAMDYRYDAWRSSQDCLGGVRTKLVNHEIVVELPECTNQLIRCIEDITRSSGYSDKLVMFAAMRKVYIDPIGVIHPRTRSAESVERDGGGSFTMSDLAEMVVERVDANVLDDIKSLYTRGGEYESHFLRSMVEDGVVGIRRVLEAEGDNKIVVFVHYSYESALLIKTLRRHGLDQHAMVFDGDTSISKRNNIIRSFEKSDDSRILIIQIQSGGCGLNLQFANYAYFISRSYNPCMDQQAICRLYRIGQQRDVHVVVMRSNAGIETHIQRINSKKQKLSHRSLAGSLGTVHNV